MLFDGDIRVVPDFNGGVLVAKRKDFTDERVSKKQRQLDKQSRKARKRSKKDTSAALARHRLGWVTRDGKEL